jgi:hypothetical protein
MVTSYVAEFLTVPDAVTVAVTEIRALRRSLSGSRLISLKVPVGVFVVLSKCQVTS